MSQFFIMDNNKGLNFELCVEDDDVRVLTNAVPPQRDVRQQEVTIPLDDFKEFLSFIESLNTSSLCRFLLDNEQTIGSSIQCTAYKVMDAHTFLGFEAKICLAFAGYDRHHREYTTIGFRFNMSDYDKFQDFLKPFRERLNKQELSRAGIKNKAKCFKYKPSLIVEAVPYTLGMEDGVEISMRSRFDGHLERFVVRDTIKENGATVRDNVELLYNNNKAYDVEEHKPFIDYCDHRHYIEKTDMIVTDALGNVYPMSLAVFNATFEEDVDNA